MQKLAPFTFLVLVGLGTSLCGADTIRVDPAKAVIALPADAGGAATEAAEELRMHVELITGAVLPVIAGVPVPPGKYPFRIGSAPIGQNVSLGPEEARWVVAEDATYLYGDGIKGRRGDLYAVYFFLEEQLGVRWVEPGDRGIAFKEQAQLVLNIGTFSWRPKVGKRSIRVGVRRDRPPVVKSHVAEFSAFAVSKEKHNAFVDDVRRWQRRMRMGDHLGMSYGHAFTDWWSRFGKTNPEYFALNQYGKREPEVPQSEKSASDNPLWAQLPHFETIKLCTSNPDVAKQIVQDWLGKGKPSKYVNVCENDSPPSGFCRCAGCRALDTLEPGEEYGVYSVHLTDRYVHLTNMVAREARKHDPEAWAVMYAYNETELPPRRERVEPNVVVGIVPTTTELPKLAELYGGWHARGARAMFLRPNYHHYYATTTIPMGYEKHMYEAFQIAYRNGAIGTDYDSLQHGWPVTGFSDYVLAKSFAEPSKSFEHWESHYCTAYGAAADQVREYYRYWRHKVWDERLAPNVADIVKRGKYHNFVRGVYWTLADHYRVEDFDRTDAILQQAVKMTLTDGERARLQQLVLANRHARLVFNATVTGGIEKFTHSKALLEFRVEQKDVLNLRWLPVFGMAKRFGDLTGVKTAENLKAFPLPWIQTPLAWRFRMDPQEVGLNEKWHTWTWAQTKEWELLRTSYNWENTYHRDSYPSDELREKLKAYDGIGWYTTRMHIPPDWRGRETLLYFGAVDESCWVYINGRLAGTHLFEKSDDWSTPFTIRIDPFVTWDQQPQTITVRVEDRGGAGGIWKRVWLVATDAGAK
ncbi:MAG: DUF4838 domain-containing protein [Lentisphaerae bacterium]|nr:DUF4838 domain-containing protein [Lentisphaerota bacterium]